MQGAAKPQKAKFRSCQRLPTAGGFRSYLKRAVLRWTARPESQRILMRSRCRSVCAKSHLRRYLTWDLSPKEHRILRQSRFFVRWRGLLSRRSRIFLSWRSPERKRWCARQRNSVKSFFCRCRSGSERNILRLHGSMECSEN